MKLLGQQRSRMSNRNGQQVPDYVATARAIGKEPAAGLIRLMRRSSSDLVSAEVRNQKVHFEVKNEEGRSQAVVDKEVAVALGRLFISHPTEADIELAESRLWLIEGPEGGPLPLPLLPLNREAWRAYGLGQDIVHKAREQDYSGYGPHVDRLRFQLARLAKQFGVLDEQTDSDFLRPVASVSVPRPQTVVFWFRHEWHTKGTTLFVREEVKKLRRHIRFTPINLLEISSFFCEAGEYGYALDCALEAQEKAADIWTKHRLPAVTRLLLREGYLDHNWAREDADLMDRLELNGDYFPNRVIENRKSFAVIGNGPSQIGRGTGSKIDEKKLVVRINNGGRPSVPHATDYGSRTNVWLRSLQNYDILRTPKISGVDHILISGKNPTYHTAGCAEFLKEMERTYGSISMVPDANIREVVSNIKTNPSSGVVFLNWMHRLTNHLVDQENLFGFSLTDQKVRETTHYFRSSPIRSHHTHNWDTEREYLDRLIKGGLN